MDSLWAQLLNSDWHDYRGTGGREDRIGSDPWLETFLEQTGWSASRLPDGEERDALRHLRRLARACVDAYRESGAVPPREMQALNRILAEAPVVRRIEDGWEVSLLPVKRGIQSVLAEIVASLADMLAKGEPSRVKICENPDCGWVIYDESRNRTRRWCSATECGNLIKVRRHRSRRRHAVE
jgi:predicted RNA-binding Zn ribbon-like protein